MIKYPPKKILLVSLVPALFIGACGGNSSSPGSGGNGPTPSGTGRCGSANFAYVPSTPEFNEITMYSFNSTNGVLSLLSPESTVFAQLPISITCSPNGKYIYVTSGNETLGDGTVTMFSINQATGVLSPLTPESQIATGITPLGITIDPSGQYAYVVNNNSGKITMYNINSSTGVLSPLSPESTVTVVNNGINNITFDPTGKNVYVLNGNSIIMLNFNATSGALTPLSPESMVYISQPIPSLAGIAFNSTGAYAYATDFNNNIVVMFSRNASTGVLTPLSPESTVATINEPGAIAVDPSGKYAYVANSNGWETSSISMYSINSSSGILTPLSPESSFIVSGYGASSITFAPSGNYVYMTMYDNVAMYSFDSSTGLSTPLSPESEVASGTQPIAFTFN